ncbi:MAG: hypothetical protein ACXAC5_18610 [Promethearchaeota archaeon]|jgi:hypothetical protein
MSKLPNSLKNEIAKEIEKVTDDLIYFPNFMEKITFIIERFYGENSPESNKIYNINEKNIEQQMEKWKNLGIFDPITTMRSALKETIIFLKSLQ